MKRVVRSSLERYNRVSDEYNEARARIDEQQRVRDEQETSYNKANKDAQRRVSEYVANVVRNATNESFMSNIDVSVSLFGSRKYNKFTIQVEYGRSQRYKDTPSVALMWTWSITNDRFGSDDRTVSRETGSWSGLNGTTSEQLNDLKMSVKALEALSNITDEEIVNVATSSTPNWYEYVTQDVDKLDETEYVYKKLDALSGEDVFLAGDKTWYGEYYYKIVKDTGKQYAVEVWYLAYPNHMYGREHSEFRLYDTRRQRKDKLYDMVDHPIVPVTREQIQSIMDEKNKEFDARKESE